MSLEGLGVAMVTPFNDKKEVDHQAIERLVEYQIENQTDFLVLMGTTGEYPTLTKTEIKEIVSRVKTVNRQRVPLVIGAAGNNTNDVIHRLRNLDIEGISALMLTSPHYNKPTQEGIYQHYKKISEAVTLPLIVYNVPSRTGVNIQPETFFRLCHDCKNIRMIKEAAGDYIQAQELIYRAPEEVKILSGDDHIALAMIFAGAVGSISVLGNAFPQQLSNMIRYARNGQFSDANKIQSQLLNLMTLIFKEGNPTSVKALLELLRLCSKEVRLPLVHASPSLVDSFRSELESLDSLD
ncbi:MAG: 4-hydroxy-tetrahydrodipicolinate synthase [Flavobacteriaceae bacterium]|nr:4-hydroxy-tetrahydrodipicolinate synthase [Flavobacteriaceae bacterium]